ncbi:hypothetical protein TorRG33x02_021700 [Trema orientale]|uniref:Uncharacterized protein n=1 Tax=Trema orientale TaxID=63057 RepID=A0A2P5FVS0_TREOI|nr:hypothetical protein TorRG33x02_021700 [Trema orientale]
MAETPKALNNDELKAATCQSSSANSREDLMYWQWGETTLNDELLARKRRVAYGGSIVVARLVELQLSLTSGKGDERLGSL